MSILAADRKAITRLATSSAPGIPNTAEGNFVVNDFNKITLSVSGSLALGIAGQTQDHYYTQSMKLRSSIDDVLLTIRKHMEGFLRVHDRASLSTLTSFEVNQGIVSFFDENTGLYFTNTFLFSPVGNETRLHRAADEVKIFYAGSGSKHFEKTVGLVSIDSFRALTKNACTPEACIPWMQDAFRRVSAIDTGSGADAMFVVSTRSSPRFRVIEAH